MRTPTLTEWLIGFRTRFHIWYYLDHNETRTAFALLRYLDKV